LTFLKISDTVRAENEEEIVMAKNKEVKEVIIEVGGDHGDGNVELIKKSKGVKVVIKDWDNAYLPEDADEQDAPVPEIREYKEDEFVSRTPHRKV